MTPQEILASLSRLESELNEVASARLLVEQTANSYKEVQNEIRSFVGKFQIVINSLNTVAKAFDNENQTLSNDIKNSINVVKGQLDSLNTAFANQCNSVILRFVESVNQTSETLKQKTDALTKDYKSNNDSFRNNIAELSKVQKTIVDASQSIASLKNDIATLQAELKSSQNDQDKTLDKISSDLQTANSEHTKILTQISADLKSSQDDQDKILADIKKAVDNLQEKQPEILSKTDQAIRCISDAQNSLGNRISSLESSVATVETLVSTVKKIGIVNLIAAIITIAAIIGVMIVR